MCLSSVDFNLASYENCPNGSNLVGSGFKVIQLYKDCSYDILNFGKWETARYSYLNGFTPKPVKTEYGNQYYWPGFHILSSYFNSVMYYKNNWFGIDKSRHYFVFVEVSYKDIVCVGQQVIARDLGWDSRAVALAPCVIAHQMRTNRIISSLEFDIDAVPKLKVYDEEANSIFKNFSWR